ncbi:olfactory receptor 2B6-like [Astatotilapia calliptera]|uniref:olfactory receptor 2B6-like n=1 Tax=Astatotilapia calliptera TaxID=8154 RepID=UPI000E3FCDD7|nr:olfactory receptor 2B6-like [Astatotilapia calliptera]
MDNVSNVKSFVLLGFNDTMNFRVPLFIITLLHYCVILFFNISLVLLIVLDESLHEPMYIFLSSFCINALYGSTGFYPKFLSDLLSSFHHISYEGCMLQAFIMYSFSSCDLSILAVMAFDRYLAICRPLHYHSFMTMRRLSQLVCLSWLTPFCIFSINIPITSRVKLCGINIQRVLCPDWLIVKLACPEVKSNLTLIVYIFHGFFIIWIYTHLIKTCMRSSEDRVKFMQTCVPHLTSLIIFLFVMVFQSIYGRFDSTDSSRIFQNLIAIELLTILPVMNPLIYGFKLTKIRNRILTSVYLNRK